MMSDSKTVAVYCTSTVAMDCRVDYYPYIIYLYIFIERTLIMALLKIEKAGAPVLKKKCEPIQKIDGKIRGFLDDMAETMYQFDGIGLAAPQVGRSICAVVIDIGEGKLLELINPKITEREGVSLDSEGCLSVPGMFGEVERSSTVTVDYMTRYGKRRTLEASGLLARCIQHELDHLNGILFIDIAKSLRQENAEI